jgi:hypothetical protein
MAIGIEVGTGSGEKELWSDRGIAQDVELEHAQFQESPSLF